MAWQFRIGAKGAQWVWKHRRHVRRAVTFEKTRRRAIKYRRKQITESRGRGSTKSSPSNWTPRGTNRTASGGRTPHYPPRPPRGVWGEPRRRHKRPGRPWRPWCVKHKKRHWCAYTRMKHS